MYEVQAEDMKSLVYLNSLKEKVVELANKLNYGRSLTEDEVDGITTLWLVFLSITGSLDEEIEQRAAVFLITMWINLVVNENVSPENILQKYIE